MIWLNIASKELGVKEAAGKANNKRIVEYHSTTTLKSTQDAVAWCSAFVNWVMKMAGYQRTHSAAARSWLGYGQTLTKFKPGCIVVMKRGTSAWQGHVAFGIKEDATRVLCLGGNQNNGVTQAWYPKSKVLGYQMPTDKQKLPTTVRS